MADNLDFVLDSLFPRERVIVWIANEHARYADTSGSAAAPALHSLGAHLRKRRPTQTYSVAMLETSGVSTVDAARGEVPAVFDLRAWRRQPSSSWLEGPLMLAVFGAKPSRVHVLREFDALAFVNRADSTPLALGTCCRRELSKIR